MFRILYIDDDDTNRDIVRRILSRAPYPVEVTEAADGQEGVNIAIATRPDLILMDFHMPGMPGPEAATQIRDHDLTKEIPIIALTADIYARESFREAGCNGYLTKPIRKRALLNEIGKIFPDLAPTD